LFYWKLFATFVFIKPNNAIAMKRFILLLFALAVMAPMTNSVSAQNQGDFRFGFRAGYYFNANAFGAGVYGNYGLTDWLNIEPGVNLICKENSTVDVYCDFQIPLEIATYWYVYPIVGVSAHDIGAEEAVIDSWAAGLNVGLGTSYDINGRWDVSAQAKWMGRLPRKLQSSIIVSIGIGYNF
jgi:hypothetical protein